MVSTPSAKRLSMMICAPGSFFIDWLQPHFTRGQIVPAPRGERKDKGLDKKQPGPVSPTPPPLVRRAPGRAGRHGVRPGYALRAAVTAGASHPRASLPPRISPPALPLPGGAVLRYLAPQEGTAHRTNSRNQRITS